MTVKNLSNEQLKRGNDLYREIYLIAEGGWNPRPNLDHNVATKAVVIDCLNWLEQFRDLLYPNCRTFEVLLVKNLLLRLLEDDYQRWNMLDDIRAAMHAMTDQDKRHTSGYSLWREDYSVEMYESMLEVVKENVNEKYKRWLGGGK